MRSGSAPQMLAASWAMDIAYIGSQVALVDGSHSRYLNFEQETELALGSLQYLDWSLQAGSEDSEMVAASVE